MLARKEQLILLWIVLLAPLLHCAPPAWPSDAPVIDAAVQFIHLHSGRNCRTAEPTDELTGLHVCTAAPVKTECRRF